MKPMTMVWCVLPCVLLTGCLKDGIDPPDAGGPTLEVRFTFHRNGVPFQLDSTCTDGFGTRVRFTHMRFALRGADLLGDQGQLLDKWPGALLFADLAAPSTTYLLANPAQGEVHWVDSRTCTNADATECQSLWIARPDAPFLAVLDAEGIVDSDNNGHFDPTDAPFRITVAPDDLDPALRIHAHAVVRSTGRSVLEIPVNVAGLLHDIDLPDGPITVGEGPYATQALLNLRTRVLGDDHRPQ